MRRVRHGLIVAGAAGVAGAAITSPADARAAVDQTWPPFVLVAGLLMIGVVAHADGLFASLAALASRLRAHPAVLLLALLGIVAVVTAVLNLDTSVAFLTPVLVLAARSRGIDEEPFLYGTLLMSNAASLLLPGSNLTNLVVLAHEHVAGGVFAARMLPAWIASVLVTAVFSLVVFRRSLRAGHPPSEGQTEPAPPGISTSTTAVLLAAVFVLVLPSPATPVLITGVAVAAVAVRRGSISAKAVREAVDPTTLAGVFAVAVALGVVARTWSGPAHLAATAGRIETAVIGALAAVAVNNLPAAVLLSSRAPLHPRALLLGLDLGPNLAVTGSLSALIWWRSARAIGAAPSAARLTRLGIVLVPLTIAAAAVALGN
jgi:arsenical pump membrane protein